MPNKPSIISPRLWKVQWWGVNSIWSLLSACSVVCTSKTKHSVVSSEVVQQRLRVLNSLNETHFYENSFSAHLHHIRVTALGRVTLEAWRLITFSTALSSLASQSPSYFMAAEYYFKFELPWFYTCKLSLISLIWAVRPSDLKPNDRSWRQWPLSSQDSQR